MDSTARLVWLHAPYIDLSFQLLPAGQRDMDENNPIARHRKPQSGHVAAWFSLVRLCEHRAHARVRHVSLDRKVRSRDRFAGGIG
jgi:hypothetical protein